MKENAFNLYYYYTDPKDLSVPIIGLVGGTWHEVDSKNESEALALLKNACEEDFSRVSRAKPSTDRNWKLIDLSGTVIDLPDDTMPYTIYSSMDLSHKLSIFENLFKIFEENGIKVPEQPLVCVTGVKVSSGGKMKLMV